MLWKSRRGGNAYGIIAGKTEFMDVLDGGFWQYGDNSIPEVGMTYFAATFDRHPLALAAAKAILSHLKENGTVVLKDINDKTTRLVASVNEFCRTYNLPLSLVQFGSLFKIKFSGDIYYKDLLYTLLRYKGVHIYDGIPCFLSGAHTENDVDAIVQAFKESIAEMIDAGFFHFSMNKEIKFIKEPPIKGAKLGRDNNGNAGWFIIDPKRTGKYLKLEAKS